MIRMTLRDFQALRRYEAQSLVFPKIEPDTSTRRQRARVWCEVTGKRSFVDQEEADAAIRTIHRTTDRQKEPVRSYPCPFCDGHHITARETFDELL